MIKQKHKGLIFLKIFGIEVSIIIAVISLGFSIISTVITVMYGFLKSRPNLNVQQLGKSDERNYLINSYDGCVVDSKYNNEYIIYPSIYGFLDLTFTNLSSLPITIIELHTENALPYDGSITTLGPFDISLDDIGNYHKITEYTSYLSLPIKLDPYESVRAYVFFNYASIDKIKLSQPIKISIRTSRKTFRKSIKYYKVLKSVTPKEVITQDSIGGFDTSYHALSPNDKKELQKVNSRILD